MEGPIKQFKRLFIAVRIIPDSSFRRWYNQLKETLKKEEIRWTREENIHLTLLFIGDTNVDLLPAIISSLQHSVVSFKPFCFSLSGMGVFRSLKYPKVLWVGLRETETLGLIKAEIDKHLHPLLDLKENIGFKPHLTIGRMRRVYDAGLLKEIISKYRDHYFFDVEVNEIIFYESILKKSGPVYEIIEKIPLLHQDYS